MISCLDCASYVRWFNHNHWLAIANTWTCILTMQTHTGSFTMWGSGCIHTGSLAPAASSPGRPAGSHGSRLSCVVQLYQVADLQAHTGSNHCYRIAPCKRFIYQCTTVNVMERNFNKYKPMCMLWLWGLYQCGLLIASVINSVHNVHFSTQIHS